MKREWILATMLLAGCRPAVAQPIAPFTGEVRAIAVGGGDVWWIETEGESERILRAPITGGDARSACGLGESIGLALLGEKPFTMTVGREPALASCRDAGGASHDELAVQGARAPVVDGGALVWTELMSAGGASTVALRRWSPGEKAPATLWRGHAMTMPPPAPAVCDDGTILWQGSGGILSMSPDGRVARVATTTASITLAAGGRAWWEYPAAWFAPPVRQQQLALPAGATPPPPLWQRVRGFLGLAPSPDVAEPGVLTIAGSSRTIDTGIVSALAGDARSTAWVDDGVPMHVRHGPAGQYCNACFDDVEPVPGTGAVRVSDGRTMRTLAHGEFARAIAVEGDWVYVADTKARRIERISR